MKHFVGFAIALSVFAADKAKAPEPGYDVATVVDVKASVTDVRKVSKGEALEGVHLTVKWESQTLNVYVGPAEFVKMFDVSFSKGDEIRVTGSKVEFEGSTLLLASEITIGKVTLLCRDKDGSPLWRYFMKPPVG
jgi:hypothetical protein